MNRSVPVRVAELLTRDEIRDLVTQSRWRGLAGVLWTWSLIAAAFALAATWTNPLTVAVAIVVLGGRQLALAVLMHEASHRTLHPKRDINDRVGQWLCAWPIWADVHRYRSHHMQHHAHTGGVDDPDLPLVTPFPVTRGSLARKLLRDLTGLAGMRRALGLCLMDLGFLSYSVSGAPERRDQAGRTWREVARAAARNTSGVLLAQCVLGLALSAFGVGWLMLLWVAAWLTTYGLFVRIRSIAEHAAIPASDRADPLRNTRTTATTWLSRLTVAPHEVAFHLEHHLLMTVPFYNLRRMHGMLLERGALEGACLARGYSEVLHGATRP